METKKPTDIDKLAVALEYDGVLDYFSKMGLITIHENGVSLNPKLRVVEVHPELAEK